MEVGIGKVAELELLQRIEGCLYEMRPKIIKVDMGTVAHSIWVK